MQDDVLAIKTDAKGVDEPIDPNHAAECGLPVKSPDDANVRGSFDISG
ncbi:MAG: hypothetical protein ABI672_17255 [Vicinamibacteria bacterium]